MKKWLMAGVFLCVNQVWADSNLLQPKNEMNQWQIQAMQGNPIAQYQLAQFYAQNEQWHDAEIWYEQAAQQGHAVAQTQLAWLRYAAHDYDAAAQWYTAAAEQGDAEAQFNLALLYERGDGVAQDAATALKWYQQAAPHSPKAQTRLGWLHEEGKFVPKNPVQAAKWYEQAAKTGYAEAQFNLAILLDEQGKYAAAAKWYEKAAAQKHARALYNLAVLYQDGKGVPANPRKVRQLLQQATQLGLPEAEAALQTK